MLAIGSGWARGSGDDGRPPVRDRLADYDSIEQGETREIEGAPEALRSVEEVLHATRDGGEAIREIVLAGGLLKALAAG